MLMFGGSVRIKLDMPVDTIEQNNLPREIRLRDETFRCTARSATRYTGSLARPGHIAHVAPGPD